MTPLSDHRRMTRFPAIDVALEGFRVTREQPRAVVLWGLVFLAANLVGQAGLVASGAYDRIAALSPARPPTPEAANDIVAALGPTLGLIFIVSMAVNVLLYTAVLRAVLQPGEARAGYLRLGMDEARQFGLALFISALWILYAAAIEIMSSTLGNLASGLADPFGGVLKGMVFAAVIIAFVYPIVRLSLAPAMTFAERRISLVRAWALTEGRFWSLLGAYLLAGALALLVMLLTILIFGAVATVAGKLTSDAIDIIGASTQKGDMTMTRLFSPTGLALIAINAICSTLAFAIVMAVSPAAFRQLSGGAGAGTR